MMWDFLEPSDHDVKRPAYRVSVVVNDIVASAKYDKISRARFLSGAVDKRFRFSSDVKFLVSTDTKWAIFRYGISDACGRAC